MPLDLTILAPSVVTKVISRLTVSGNTMQRFWGFESGGSNVEQLAPDGVRQYSYDIFDNVRTLARGRGPATGPATITRNPVGINTVTIARSYEKETDISYEILSNIRSIGSDAGELDRKGMRYLERQGQYLQQRQVNFREFLTWGMMRGIAYFIVSGEDWYASLTPGTVVVDWKIPSGNKGTLDMLGAGAIIDATWGTAATNILGHLDKISSAFQQLVGAPLAWCMTDSTTWNFVLLNDGVTKEAGTANTAFDTFEMSGEKAKDGSLTGLRYGVLKARPWIKWYITDAGLTFQSGGAPTFQKFFQNGEISFGIDPVLGYAKMQEGSELVKETPWDTGKYQRGFHSWLREWDEPARVELHSINNLVPELNI